MQKLVKLSEIHYVIIDDSEIKEGDWYITDLGNIYQEIKRMFEEDAPRFTYPEYRKVTHSTKPLDGVPYIELSEVLNAIDKSIKLSSEYYDEMVKYDTRTSGQVVGMPRTNKERMSQYQGYIDGFKAGILASEIINKDRVFTFDDMRIATINAYNLGTDIGNAQVIGKIEEVVHTSCAIREWEIEINLQNRIKLFK